MPAQQTQPRIVLADDHDSIVIACRRLLGAEFDVVATARHGQEALDVIATHTPDIVVLDLSMPILTGVEVLEVLHDRGGRTRAVVLTVNADSAIADRAIELGAYGYVVKSRMARDLAPAIRAALAGTRFRSPIPG